MFGSNLKNENICYLSHLRIVSFSRVIPLLLGLALFFNAKSMSRNLAFHYAGGITSGIAFAAFGKFFFRNFKNQPYFSCVVHAGQTFANEKKYADEYLARWFITFNVVRFPISGSSFAVTTRYETLGYFFSKIHCSVFRLKLSFMYYFSLSVDFFHLHYPRRRIFLLHLLFLRGSTPEPKNSKNHRLVSSTHWHCSHSD